MSIVSNALHWANQFAALQIEFRNIFPESDRYVDSASLAIAQPLSNAFPLSFTDFFGPKILNILIVGEPYGWVSIDNEWEFQWPPAGFDEALLAIRERYDQWSNYKLFMYADTWLVHKAQAADPTSNLPMMMQVTFDKLQEICETNVDLGFEWKGNIPDNCDYTFFLPEMTTYYLET